MHILVNDILRQIFQHASITEHPNLDWQQNISCYSPKQVLKLRSVCGKWKELVESDHTLWTFIHFGKHFGLVQLQLRLSGNAPVHIILHDTAFGKNARRDGSADPASQQRSPAQMLSILQENIHRVSTLFLLDRGVRGLRDVFATILTCTAPRLQAWHMQTTNSSHSDFLLYPFTNSTPLLRHVSFKYYLPHEDAKVWDNLHSVIIASPKRSKKRDIISLFRRSPKLRSLKSDGMTWMTTRQAITSSRLEIMSELVSLELSQVRWADITPLLQSVDFPALNVLKIETERDEHTQPEFTSIHEYLRTSPGLQSFLSKLRFLDVISRRRPTILKAFTPEKKMSMNLIFNEEYHENQLKDIFYSFPNAQSLCIGPHFFEDQLVELPNLGISTTVKELRIGSHAGATILFRWLVEKKMVPALRKVAFRHMDTTDLQDEALRETVYELLSRGGGQAPEPPCVEIYGWYEANEIAPLRKYFEERDVLVSVESVPLSGLGLYVPILFSSSRAIST